MAQVGDGHFRQLCERNIVGRGAAAVAAANAAMSIGSRRREKQVGRKQWEGGGWNNGEWGMEMEIRESQMD